MTRQVEGIAEIVLWVRDMDVALNFYQEVLGLELISPPGLPNKFLKAADGELGVPDMIVLVPHPEGVAFPREKQSRVLHHIAFRVGRDLYDGLRERFEKEEIEVRSGVHPVLKDVRTFYVDDPDGNEVECISPDPGSEGS
jgi:catechol 2,3-dioxygenase-like lactoylglutathione lyase family enzyme